MLKYLYFQLKRSFRVILIVALCLFLFLGIGYLVLSNQEQTTEAEDQRLSVALCGDVDHPYFALGLNTLESLDDIRYTIQLQIMDESSAEEALMAGQIDAYAILPKGFMENALGGDLKPIKFISHTGAIGIDTLIQEELTKAIGILVLTSQRAMLAFYSLKEQNTAFSGLSFSPLSVAYMEYVLGRANALDVVNLEREDPKALEAEISSGIFVLFAGLLAMPFAYLYIKKDMSLSKLLASKCRGAVRQSFCRTVALFISITLLLFVIVLGAWGLISGYFPEARQQLLWRLIPVAFCVASFACFVFSLSRSFVGGLLFYFITVLALGFLSGCMYPLHFFPQDLQNLGEFMPFAAAKAFLLPVIIEDFASDSLWLMFGWSTLFSGGACLVYTRACRKGRS